MRYVYIRLIVAFTALVVLFKFQNLETVTVSLFSASMTLSVSTLVAPLRAGNADGRFPVCPDARPDSTCPANSLNA